MKIAQKNKMDGGVREAGGKFELYRTFLEDGEASPFYAKECDDPLTGAFDKKVSVHAGLSGSKIPEDRIDEFYGHLASGAREGKTAAYIHIPFCENHCLYCGFFGKKFHDDAAEKYTDSLIMELENSAGTNLAGSGPIHSVYLGGGTPTALSAKDLKRLLDAVRIRLPLANDCEITVEGRIHNFDQNRISACIDGGANRFSLGVQTFDTRLRHKMRRFVTKEEAVTFIEKLAKRDQAAVVIDLIYGFPGQTMDMWEEDLKLAASLPLDGLDLYQLNVFRTSPLFRAIEQGIFPPAPGIPGQAAMFEKGVRFMEKERWRRISVSHWARTQRERNLYNLMMKSRNSCLQYGAGAGGCVSDHMIFNESSPDEYMKKVGAGRKPVAAIIAPPDRPEIVKGITGGLEQLRLDLKSLGSSLGTDLEKLFSNLLCQWERAGLIRMDGGWIELTLAGQFWEVNLAQALIDYYNTVTQKDIGGVHETLAVNA